VRNNEELRHRIDVKMASASVDWGTSESGPCHVVFTVERFNTLSSEDRRSSPAQPQVELRIDAIRLGRHRRDTIETISTTKEVSSTPEVGAELAARSGVEILCIAAELLKEAVREIRSE
jgi:hypothetical protein